MASIGAPSSRKSLKKSSRSSQQRVSQMRDKVADIEQSLNALKENVNKTHNQSLASEKNVTKAVKST
jgi:septal ring factor EnvC (AmiA/AmiB activator)